MNGVDGITENGLNALAMMAIAFVSQPESWPVFVEWTRKNSTSGGFTLERNEEYLKFAQGFFWEKILNPRG